MGRSTSLVPLSIIRDETVDCSNRASSERAGRFPSGGEIRDECSHHTSDSVEGSSSAQGRDKKAVEVLQVPEEEVALNVQHERAELSEPASAVQVPTSRPCTTLWSSLSWKDISPSSSRLHPTS